MRGSTPVLGAILASFFNDHLKLRRGLRPNSITSYADAIRLLLQFAAATGKKKVTQLGLDDLDADVVCRFLNSLEKTRGNAGPPAISDWRRSARSSNTLASDSRRGWSKRRRWLLFQESGLSLRKRSF